jgi:predicted O-methyltransferase YrrM
MKELWTRVDQYLEDLLAPADERPSAILRTNQTSELPSIDVPPLLGRFLDLMVRITGAQRVLEVGTLGGYSTFWMARALPEGGHLVTLELEPRHAEIARANLGKAGVLDRVEVRVGPAADSMRKMEETGEAPFDLIFLDADKQGLPEYLKLSLKLSRPGTVILADNVVRDGEVIEPDNSDPNVQGVRRFLESVASEPRLTATALPTVGARGYDGFAIVLVLK